MHAHCGLTSTRSKERTSHADDIADVVEIELREDAITKLVAPEVELDTAIAIGQMRKDSLPVRPPRHDATGQLHFGPLLHAGRQQPQRGLRRVRTLEAVRKRWHA